MPLRPLIALLLIVPVMTGGCDRQSRSAEQANATASTPMPDEVAPQAGASKPATPAANGILDRSHAGEPASSLPIMDPGDKPVKIADFAGKPVLLNLWATWCAPCVAEMPTLDALAAQQGDALVVLAVSQDLEGAAKVDPFFKNAAFKALKPYRDPQAALSTAYQANLPTTILYDARGIEVWRVLGGMDWTSKQATDLIAEAR